MSQLDDYAFDLPAEQIAQYPLANRADARLMVVWRSTGKWEHRHVRDLPEILESNDTLVLNRSRVVPARLLGRRADTNGRWEGLYLAADPNGTWRIVCKTRGKLTPGTEIVLRDSEGRERGRLFMLTPLEDGEWAVRVDGPEGESPLDVLEQVGHVPLPHYIRDGQMVDSDRDNYQTVYADRPGSVAAPTAGLHFTRTLLGECNDRGINLATVTLHVGLGTFRPIKAERLEDHTMHAEFGEVDARVVERLHATRQRGGRIIAVGTTSVRVLETASAGGELAPWAGDTRLFIRPPYQFRAVDALLTNFHLPKSTLMVLVATFGGEVLMRDAYREAIAEGYRFYSYGDAMLIL